MAKHYSTRDRYNIFQREKANAWIEGRGRLPICVHCDLPVDPLHCLWDVSHRTVPRAFGGKSVGIGHHECNMADGRDVTRAFHRSNSVRASHIGADGPGLGKTPMQGGRRSRLSKTMRNGPVPRLTQAEKHARAIAALALIDADGMPIGLWAPPTQPEA